MTAKLAPRITTENRTRLETVIPLSTPYLVFLDPSDVCNAKCSWCPTGSGEALKWKKPGMMDFDLYRRIINDLATMPEMIKTLRLYKDGEPLLNALFPEMVSYAKETGRFGRIDTTSNGLCLSGGLNKVLCQCGLDKIFISVPWGYSFAYRENVRDLFVRSRGRMEIHVKIIGDWLNKYQQGVFLQDFGNISDTIFIENLAPCWPDFEVKEVGNVGIYNQPLKKAPKVCPYLFYSLAINRGGTVSACFLDWRHEMLLGDLKEQSFSDIWNGPMLRQIQMLNLRKYRSKISTNCANCKQLVYGAPDDIDEYAGEILRRME